MDNRLKVFIVEDEALIANEIQRAVEGFGYAVSGICYDHDSAAAAIPDADADLFMLDINLGSGDGRNGVALAGIIREQNPRPFIFLTAYSDRDTIAKATALHPSNYLIKPVAPAMLFAAIQLSIARTQDSETVAPAHEGLPDFFYVKVGNRTTRLQWKDVYCMETSKNYVRIFATGQTGDYPIRGTLSFVLDRLVPEPLRAHFFRLGRNLCLNSQHLGGFSEDAIACGDRNFENGGRLSEGQYGMLVGERG